MKGMYEQMKKITFILYLSVAFLLLAGCADDTNETSVPDAPENSSEVERVEEEAADTVETDETAADAVEETGVEEKTKDNQGAATAAGRTTYEENNLDEGEELLSQYTSEQIEYARIWSQLGPNQEIDRLYIQHIPAGTPINPNDETSASYPEDVIHLAGGRIVDGSVTYSGNGDGTINVYNVPYRWETNLPEDLDENYMRVLTEEIISDTKFVYIEPENGESIKKIIELQHVDD